MIYYQNNTLIIRPIKLQDAQAFEQAFRLQNWERKAQLFTDYYYEQSVQLRYVFVAEYLGKVAGYLTLVPLAQAGPFKDKWPELVDFNVLEAYQEKGIGSHLMEAAETFAKDLAPVVTLGVGLHTGYGAAQRLYAKRGYIPDGSGIWYHNQPLALNAPCYNDNDLVLYLAKSL